MRPRIVFHNCRVVLCVILEPAPGSFCLACSPEVWSSAYTCLSPLVDMSEPMQTTVEAYGDTAAATCFPAVVPSDMLVEAVRWCIEANIGPVYVERMGGTYAPEKAEKPE